MNCRRFHLFLLLLLPLLIACDKNENINSFCKIYFSIETTEFYQGCIVAISIKAGEGINKETEVQLFINEQDMGFIQTSPYTYYWHTDGVAVGFQTIKAIYTNSDNQTISDERSIKILPVSASCPEDVMDIDGNIYPVVQIGNQCWMQANLKTTNYPDGEPLINGIDSLVGGLPNELPGWYFAYNKDSNYIHSYGYLYTWVTAMKGNTAAAENTRPIQGICPDGWHVPNADEWRVLIDFLGGLEMAGDRLKDPNVNTWTDSLSDLTSNGFNALPGGCRVSDGSYIEESNSAYFWTATETIPNHAYHILLNNNNSKAAILGHQDSKRFGYSVRCVKD
jgi:uncharacterized protein (TIGR02145 family)